MFEFLKNLFMAKKKAPKQPLKIDHTVTPEDFKVEVEGSGVKEEAQENEKFTRQHPTVIEKFVKAHSIQPSQSPHKKAREKK